MSGPARAAFIPAATLLAASEPSRLQSAVEERKARLSAQRILVYNVVDLLLGAETGEESAIALPSFDVYRVQDDNRFSSKEEYVNARGDEAAASPYNESQGCFVLVSNLEYLSYEFVPSDVRRVVWKWLDSLVTLVREAENVALLATFLQKEGDENNKMLQKAERLFDRTIHLRPIVRKELPEPMPPMESIFYDIIGYEHTKAELDRTVRWRWYKGSSLKRLGLTRDNQGFGALLVGPSGCGKTKFAEALGREPGVHFATLRVSEVYSKWFGDSEKHVREAFAKARQMRPCILFLDEIESFAPERSALEDQSGVNTRIIATLLNEIDGVDSDNEGLIILGATTDVSKVDRALTRPGRLGTIIHVGFPILEDRKQLLVHFTKGITLDVNSGAWLDEIAKSTRGFSVAQLESLCQASISSALWSAPNIQAISSIVLSESHFLQAKQSMIGVPSMFDVFDIT